MVEAAGIGPGMRVLDLGAGSGNTALLAAGQGAEVTAVDLTDDLFATCRQRAAAVEATVTWAAVNPEDLPFGADQFDRVVSAVGGPLAMASNQRRVAAEMARVRRPGGVLAVANWTAGGLVGQAARVIASYLPPPPPGAPSPWAWAAEGSVKALLDPFGYAVRLTPADGDVQLPFARVLPQLPRGGVRPDHHGTAAGRRAGSASGVERRAI